jgi:hypothetical protein
MVYGDVYHIESELLYYPGAVTGYHWDSLMVDASMRDTFAYYPQASN